MLTQVPAWALVTVAIASAAVVGEIAYLVVRSGGDGDGPGSAAAQLPCDENAVNETVEGGRFEQEVRDIGTVPPLAEVLEVYDAKLVGCTDLTGDGSDEMVVRLLERGVAPVDGAAQPGPASDSPTPWAIYTVRAGEWIPAATRPNVATIEVAIEESEVRERTPALVEGDALCCPTGEREGVVRWDGDAFVYRAEGAPRGSTIALADGAPAALAGFDLRSGSLVEATALFGPPTTYAPTGEVCPAEWADLGLTIEFAHFGGADPCGVEGRVATARVEGPEARQTGWKTQEGATLGVRKRRLGGMYPEIAAAEETTELPIEPAGRLFTLVAGPADPETGETAPALSARVDNGRVVGFELTVNAAGG